MFSASWSSTLLIQLSASFDLCLIPASVVFTSLIVFFIPEWFFLMLYTAVFMLLVSLLKFSLCSLSILTTSVLNSTLEGWFLPFHLVQFLEVSPVLYLGHVSLFLHSSCLSVFASVY